jgi:hypothetical protein
MELGIRPSAMHKQSHQPCDRQQRPQRCRADDHPAPHSASRRLLMTGGLNQLLA